MAKKKQAMNPFETIVEFDENFQEIIQFYLFECPIEGVSHRGKTFKEMNWRGSSRFQMLERLLIAESGIPTNRWQILESTAEVKKRVSRMSFDDQFLVSDNSKGKVQTFIYSIRNAFAHGSFDIIERNKNKYYLFENEYRGNLRTKALLSEKTLLAWIKIIKTNPEYLTKGARKKGIKYE